MHDTQTQPEVVALLQREIERVLESPERSGAGRRLKTPRSPRGGWRIAAVAAGCAIVLFVVGAVIRQGDRTPGAEAALADVARKIELAPQPRPDQFVYTKSRDEQLSPTPAGIDALGRPSEEFLSSRVGSHESWISTERKGRLAWQFDLPTYPTPRDAEIGKRFWRSIDESNAIQSDPNRHDDRLAVNRRIQQYERKTGITGIAMPAPVERETGVMMPSNGIFIGSEHIPTAKIAEYPRDPAEIYRRVRAGAERRAKDMHKFAVEHPEQADLVETDPDLEVWRTLTNPTGTQEIPAPADLRAAMVKALALIPDVKAVGERTDPKGRTGPAFEWNHHGVRETVIYDAQTSAMLNATSILTDPSAHPIAAFHRLSPGTKIYEYQLIEQKTLDKLPPRR